MCDVLMLGTQFYTNIPDFSFSRLSRMMQSPASVTLIQITTGQVLYILILFYWW